MDTKNPKITVMKKSNTVKPRVLLKKLIPIHPADNLPVALQDSAEDEELSMVRKRLGLPPVLFQGNL